MGDVQTRPQMRPAGVVIAFPPESERPVRATLAENEPRGDILLFTGIRYERMRPGTGPTLASDSYAKRRRRR